LIGKAVAMPGSRREIELQIERFHGVDLEQVLGEIEYLRDAGDTVIAGGSLAYGLGNSLSDLDLLISGPTTVESSRVPLDHFLGSLRVDVWKLSQELIESSFRQVEQALAAEAELLGRFGDSYYEDEFKLLQRVAFSVVLDGPELEFGPLDCRTVASGFVMREYAERMRASALVAQVALRAGRSTAAVVNARLAVENALNAGVAQRGIPFCGDKWLGERLDAELPGLAGIYEPFHRLPTDLARDGSDFVEAALDVCAEMWCVELELDALAELACWHNADDVRMAEVGTDHFLLAPRHGVIWELDECDAEACRRLVTAEPDEGWRLADCDPVGMAMCMQLYEHGLLSIKWMEGIPIAALDADWETTA